MGRIAYNSLTPTLTADYDEQSSINGIRMVYSIAGSLGAVVLGTIFGWVFGDDGGRLFLTLGVVLSALITVPPLIVTRVTKERNSSHPGEQPPSWETI